MADQRKLTFVIWKGEFMSCKRETSMNQAGGLVASYTDAQDADIFEAKVCLMEASWVASL